MSYLDQSGSQADTAGCRGFCRESSHPFSISRQMNDNFKKQLLTREDQQKKKEIDSMLSQAFKTLTFEERQIQQEELHGVADKLAEEASLIENALQELEAFLLETKAGSVYEAAEQMNPQYVHERNFRISFLRAERYNTRAAADRMLRFFNEKQKLFGTEKLTKDITIDDLDEDDLETLRAGGIQWAGKDQSHRPILLQIAGLRKSALGFKELKNELRTRYFVMMEGVKSSEAQLRGIVALNYMVGDCRDHTQGQGYKEHAKVSESIPIYPGAFHFASDDLQQHIFLKVTISLISTHLRTRIRLHFGTHLECQYLLSSYGIPTGLLPISPETNSVDLEPHLRWCQSYISKEEYSNGAMDFLKTTPSSAPTSGLSIIVPNPNDVLSAGSKKVDSVGNERLQELVKESMEAYLSGSYADKRRIVAHIIDEIHGAGGRFLEQEMGSKGWKELPASKVRLKMTQRFRNHNRRRETVSQQAREGTLIADMPNEDDVIFGKGQRSKGTAFLHQLMKDRSEEYEALDRKKKFLVVDAIIEQIKCEGGRFLQNSTSELGGYVELSNDAVRERTSACFRNNRRPHKGTTTR